MANFDPHDIKIRDLFFPFFSGLTVEFRETDVG